MINENLLSLSYEKVIEKDINTTDGLLPASFESYQILEPGMIVLRLTDVVEGELKYIDKKIEKLKSLKRSLISEVVTG